MKALDAAEAIAREIGGKVREDYSGRGMYGKTCLGIVCDDDTECIELAAQYGFRRAQTDSMGKQMIVYWPHIKADTTMPGDKESDDD